MTTKGENGNDTRTKSNSNDDEDPVVDVGHQQWPSLSSYGHSFTKRPVAPHSPLTHRVPPPGLEGFATLCDGETLVNIAMMSRNWREAAATVRRNGYIWDFVEGDNIILQAPIAIAEGIGFEARRHSNVSRYWEDQRTINCGGCIQALQESSSVGSNISPQQQ